MSLLRTEKKMTKAINFPQLTNSYWLQLNLLLHHILEPPPNQIQMTICMRWPQNSMVKKTWSLKVTTLIKTNQRPFNWRKVSSVWSIEQLQCRRKRKKKLCRLEHTIASQGKFEGNALPAKVWWWCKLMLSKIFFYSFF